MEQQLHAPRRKEAEPVSEKNVSGFQKKNDSGDTSLQPEQFRDDMQDIKGDKKFIWQTWILYIKHMYIVHASCIFDIGTKFFWDMESIIDNWSNCLPTFEETKSCTYGVIVPKF